MAKKRDVLVRIGADDSEFKKKAKDSGDAFDKMASVGKKAGSVIAAGFAAAGAAVATLTARGLELGNQLDDLAQRFGTTANFVAEMGHVAKLSGVELTELEQGFQKLAKRGPLEQQLNLYADQFASLTSHTDKAKLAQELFGERVGATLIPLLNQGSAGLAKLREEARGFGLTLDEVQRKNITEAGDAIDRLKSAGDGLSLQLAGAFGPAIEAAAGAIQWLTEKVVESLPKLQAMAERFLGIKAAADDLADSALQATLVEQIRAMDALNNRIAEQQYLLKYSPGPANEMIMNDLLEDQAELQARINELLAERIKRSKQGIDPASGIDDGSAEDPFAAIAKEAQVQTAILQERLDGAEALRELEAELLDEELQAATDRLEALLEIKEQERLSEKELVDALLIERHRYSQELAEQDAEDLRRSKQVRMDTVDNAFAGFTEITGALANHNKKMFDLNKKSAKAEAALNAYRAIQQVWADATLPFYAKIAATAITAAKTAANISAINSTSFGSGTTPSAAGGSTVNNVPVSNRTITVRGVSATDLITGRQLIELLNEATKDGAKLVLVN